MGESIWNNHRPRPYGPNTAGRYPKGNYFDTADSPTDSAVEIDGIVYVLNDDGTVGQVIRVLPLPAPKTPSAQPPQPKTPDPVITDVGHDYAGLAIPIRGRISIHVNLGVGQVLRSDGLAMDFRAERDSIQEALIKAKTRRRRPRMDTRSWGKTAQDMKRKFDQVADTFAQEFQRDLGRARLAAERIRDLQNLIEGGHGHIMHFEL